MRGSVLALALAAGSALPAGAQVDLGAAVGPDAFLGGSDAKLKKPPVPLPPLALATSLAFDATTWTSIGVSSAPARDLSDLLKKGYYKLELFQTILLAQRAKTPLKTLSEEHDKGDAMREIAKRRGVEFETLYEDALSLDADVETRLLPSILRLAPSSARRKSSERRKR